jgi:hypothetical protein
MMTADKRELYNVPFCKDGARALNLGGAVGRRQHARLLDMKNLAATGAARAINRHELAIRERHHPLPAFLSWI